MENPVMKFRPEEFLVVESLIPPFAVASDADDYSYLRLRKSGYTTLHAVKIIGDYFRVSRSEVDYAGLKDEDAVTEQMISIHGRISSSRLGRFNAAHANGQSFLALTPFATGREKIRIGRLNGNSFRLCIRRMSSEFAAALGKHRRATFHFLNYYDDQRFGVADGPKTTHRIGQAVLAQDWHAAIELLRRAGTPESSSAQAFTGDPEEFFRDLDPRVTDFFKSSCVSARWNAALSRAVMEHCAEEDTYVYDIADQPLALCASQTGILDVLRRQPALPYEKHYDSGETGFRSTVIQTQILVNDVRPDDANEGYTMCDVSFFLPSGAYATMCVRQVANMRELFPAPRAFAAADA